MESKGKGGRRRTMPIMGGALAAPKSFTLFRATEFLWPSVETIVDHARKEKSSGGKGD